MAKQQKTYEGTGATIDAAVGQIYGNLENQGLSKDNFRVTGYQFTIGTQDGSKRGTGEQFNNHDYALVNALGAAGISHNDYNAKQNDFETQVTVKGVYEPQQKAKGQPSGAAPSRTRGTTITDLF